MEGDPRITWLSALSVELACRSSWAHGRQWRKIPTLGLCSRLTFLLDQTEMEALQGFRLSVLAHISPPCHHGELRERIISPKTSTESNQPSYVEKVVEVYFKMHSIIVTNIYSNLKSSMGIFFFYFHNKFICTDEEAYR